MNTPEWISKPRHLSVRNLKMWGDNPRLDPSQTYVTLQNFAEGICDAALGDEDAFVELVDSIAKDGFVPIDPIVVWKNPSDGKFVVAEGNRRILALKLLQSPVSAPKSIRNRIQKASEMINGTQSIHKIPVLVAPSLNEVQWYIAQRHSKKASLLKSWNHEQQFRFVVERFKIHNDVKTTEKEIGLPASEILDIVRMIHLKDYAIQLRNAFSQPEMEALSSSSFPLTTLERFVKAGRIKDKLRLELNGEHFSTSLEKDQFDKVLSSLVKLIISKRINSRSSEEDAVRLLPEPTAPQPSSKWNVAGGNKNSAQTATMKTGERSGRRTSKRLTPEKDNPNRKKMVPSVFVLGINEVRIAALFGELKKLSVSSFANIAAAALRILLDLSVHSYLTRKGLTNQLIQAYKKDAGHITLSQRLDFLKKAHLSKESIGIISKLLEPKNDFSLDVLNGYMHSEKNAYVEPKFINRFFDFMFSLLKELDDITEIEG